MNQVQCPSCGGVPQTTTPKPITLRIGYEWAEEDPATGKRPNDEIWKFMRDAFGAVLDSVEDSSLQRVGGKIFCYRLARMRARHGSEMCSRFIELCRESDILAFDITTRNPNVMFELGLAVAVKGTTSGRVFIFEEEKPGQPKCPSDLSGYFLTYYRRGKKGLEIKDKQGFLAALRSIILDEARARGMWGSRIDDIEGEPLTTKNQ